MLKFEVMFSIDGAWISTGIASMLQVTFTGDIHYGLFYFTFTLPVLKIEAMSSTGGVRISSGIAST